MAMQQLLLEGRLYDASSGELREPGATADSAAVRLDPIVAAVLACLLEEPGRLLSRDELMQRVWRDRVVVDEALTRCISVLRHVFGDRRPHTIVQTLPKRGYRWVGDVCVIGPPTSMPVVRQLDAGKALVQRDRKCVAQGSGAPDEDRMDF